MSWTASNALLGQAWQESFIFEILTAFYIKLLIFLEGPFSSN